MKVAIVLSGGGSNGAYQIGVWKAIKKLKIKYDIVTGTSVGAINGAMMTQKTYHKAYYFWKRLDFDMIFDEKLENSYNTKEGKKEVVKMYTKNIIFEGGMKVKKLENLLKKVINIKKIYNSNINFGLVTFKLSKLKSVEKTKSQINPNEFVDYVMASATCFPAFQKKIINNDSYIDGGIYDNLPINLAINMGAEKIIAVDLNCVGVKQKMKENVDITYISPRRKIGSFLIFNSELSNRAIDLGYNDTMKTFQKLDGNIYTFKKNHLNNLIRDYQNIFNEELNKFLPQKSVYNTLITNIIKITYKTNKTNKDNIIPIIICCAIDNLGENFNMNDTKIYKIFDFNSKILFKLDKIVDDSKLKLIEKDSKKRIKHLYEKISYCVENNVYNEIDKNILLYPKDFVSALYLYIIKNK